MNFLVASLIAFLAYLSLTVGSGPVLGLWSTYELFVGAFIAIVSGWISRKIFFYYSGTEVMKVVNPIRWLSWIVYLLGPFALGLIKANIDVASRVITGNINPGIVKVQSGLKTDLGVTMLANSITLTPGTLTVDMDDSTNELYIHWIDVKNSDPSPQEVFGSFGDWIRRIAE